MTIAKQQRELAENEIILLLVGVILQRGKPRLGDHECRQNARERKRKVCPEAIESEFSAIYTVTMGRSAHIPRVVNIIEYELGEDCSKLPTCRGDTMTSRTVTGREYFSRYYEGTSVRATVLEETEDEEDNKEGPRGMPYVEQRTDLLWRTGNE